MLQLLLPFQIFFIPGLVLLLLWSVYRTVIKKDRAVGLGLYLALVIIVDGFLNTGIYVLGLEQGSIKYSEICALFLIVNSPIATRPRRRGELIYYLFFLYFLLMFFSSFRGYTLVDGLFEFRKYMVPQIISFLVSYKGFDNEEDYNRFLYCLIPLVLIVSLVTFWDVFFDRNLLKSDMLYKPEYWHNRKIGRFGSVFLCPGHMGTFAALLFPALFIAAVREQNKWKKLYCLIGLLALSFAFVETQARAPILGFVASMLFFFVIPTKGYSMMKKVVYTSLFLFVLFLFMPGFVEHATSRFKTVETEFSEEGVSRKTTWLFTQKIIGDYPLFGIGFGEEQYIDHMVKYGFRDQYSAIPLDNPHNSYLQIAVYAGIPALITFILFNIALIKGGIAVILRNKESELAPYLTGFLAGIVGFLLNLYVDMLMFSPTVAPAYWIICGLVSQMIYSLNATSIERRNDIAS